MSAIDSELNQHWQEFLGLADKEIHRVSSLSGKKLCFEEFKSLLDRAFSSGVGYGTVKSWFESRDFRDFFYNWLRVRGLSKRLHIVTCPDYVSEIATHLFDIFDDIFFYDGVKHGECISLSSDYVILNPDELASGLNEKDVVFLATSTQKISDIYLQRDEIKSHHYVIKLSDLYRFNSALTHDETEMNELVNRDFDVIYISNTMTTTLAPLLEQFSEKVSLLWAFQMDTQKEEGYQGILTRDVKIEDKIQCAFWFLLKLACESRVKRILLNAESFMNPMWDAKVSCYTYILASAMIKLMVKANKEVSLLLYDPIKPVSRNLAWQDCIQYSYLEMITVAAKIVLNSSTEEFGEFLDNVTEHDLAYVSILRRTVEPDCYRPRLSGGTHLVMISTFLGEFDEPSRAAARPYAKSALELGFHIHYYSDPRNWPKLELFRGELSGPAQKRFHLHKPILNQQELVNELQQYHFGWIIYHHQIFDEMISEVDNLFCQDAFDMYGYTTLPTTCLTLGAAGVPVLTNRAATGIIKQFHKDAVIPVNFSEVGALKSRLSEDVINRAVNAAQDTRNTFNLSHSVSRLKHFMMLTGDDSV